jgi:hypothetical protein
MSVGRWDDETLNRVYDKTGGYCRFCGKKLAWCNHGVYGARAAWHVEHSIPLSRGGTDHLNNLFPACITCNQEKGTMTGREFLSLFEDAPSPAASPWEGLAEVILGAIAVGMVFNLLSTYLNDN